MQANTSRENEMTDNKVRDISRPNSQSRNRVDSSQGERQGTSPPNRDRNNINDSVKISIDDVLAEPDTYHSADGVWEGSKFCFSCCRFCCYRFYTYIWALPLSLFWGCQYAQVAFIQIWLLTPMVKCFFVYCSLLQRINEVIVECCCKPFAQFYNYCGRLALT